MTGQAKVPPGPAPRRDRRIQEYEHDAYKNKGKLKEPTACTQCEAVYHKGRWTWNPKPAKAHETLCPACHRIKDHYPQGFLTLKGSFLAEHHEEILGLIRNEEMKEKGEHPLSRIMNIEQGEVATIITTTDRHLPRRMGEALHHAYEGVFDFHYDQDGEFIRVFWER